MENPAIETTEVSSIKQSLNSTKIFFRKKRKIILISGIVVFLLTILAIVYFLNLRETKQSQFANQNTSKISTPLPTETPKDTRVSYYLGQVKGKNILFEKPFTGSVLWEDGSQTDLKLSEIENPRLLFILPEDFNFGQFKFNEVKTKIYFRNQRSNESGIYPEFDDVIFRIDPDTNNIKEIWSRQVGSKKYPNAWGEAWLRSVVEDKFMEFDILSCYGCEPSYAGSLIVNIDTKAEKYLGSVGNIQFNVGSGTFSYQKLFPVQEACPSYPIPNCDNGMTTIDKPSGEIFTKSLP